MGDQERRWEQVSDHQLYLERVEAAAMSKLVECINELQLNEADQLVGIMADLSIV